MIDPSHTHSQKLIKCLLNTAPETVSTRFIELESYKLWSYMITHKHGFEIKETYLALWLHEDEYETKQMLYSQTGQVVRMNRIVMMVYDDANGFSFTMNRYVLEPETPMMKKVLTSHVREELVQSKSFEMRIISGYTVVNPKKLDKLVLGLSSEQIY